MLMQTTQKTQQGFSIMEVLVTVVILSVGLLGYAGLQASGLRNNTVAYQRTLATFHAYDITDRMRANSTGVISGAYDSITGTETDPGCIATNCSPASLATFDAFEWNANIAASLPSGLGTINKSGDIFTITVFWDENRTGATGTGCNPTLATDLKCYQMSFRP